MIYQLDMDEGARLLITHLSSVRKKKVKESLRAIAKDPYLGKPFQEELSGYRSYRVGSLRIIYAIDKTKRWIHVVALGPRRTIYDDLERELRRK